jgi:serine phosphatase RsbU (regulator of sigma subunit)
VGRLIRSRRTTVAALPPGAVLLCYTDGLVERRDEIIDDGIKALVGVVEADDPEAVCGTVMSRIAAQQPTDDIAILAVRRDPAPPRSVDVSARSGLSSG